MVGIPTLAATDQQLGGAAPGIGFAISSDTARLIAAQLAKSGKVTNSGRAALGVEVSTVVAGDVITAINGTPTPDAQALA